MSPAHVLNPPSAEAVAEYLRNRGYVSHSQLNMYRDCPRKFALHYIEKVPEIPQGPLIMGRALHGIVEALEVNRMHVEDNRSAALAAATAHVREEMERQVDEAGGERAVRWGGRKDTIRRDEDGKEVKDSTGKNVHAGEDFLWWRNFMGPLCVKRWFETRDMDTDRGWDVRLDQDGKPSVEMRRTISLPSGQALYLIIDGFLMQNVDTRKAKIRDWKTGQIGKASSVQLDIYAYSEIVETGEIPECEFVYLRSGDPAKRCQRVEIESYVTQEVPDWFDWLEANLKLGMFPTNPDKSWKCKTCTVKNFCPVGVTVGEAMQA